MALKTIEPTVPSCQVQTQRPIIKVTFGVHTVTSVSLERSVGNGRLAMAQKAMVHCERAAGEPKLHASCNIDGTCRGVVEPSRSSARNTNSLVEQRTIPTHLLEGIYPDRRRRRRRPNMSCSVCSLHADGRRSRSLATDSVLGACQKSG